MEHNKYSKLKIPKCPKCGEEMYLEDIHYFSEGKQDNYFFCKNDNTFWFQQFKAGKIVFDKEIKL